MSTKQMFTNDEWLTLEYAPLWILSGIAIANGRLDEKEVEAFTKELADAPFYKDELVREVMLDDLAGLDSLMASYKADTRNVETGLAQVADILEAKAPDHAENFKKVLLAIAAKVANASGPIFGEKISEKEKAVFVIMALSLRAKLT